MTMDPSRGMERLIGFPFWFSPCGTVIGVEQGGHSLVTTFMRLQRCGALHGRHNKFRSDAVLALVVSRSYPELFGAGGLGGPFGRYPRRDVAG